MGGSPSKKVIKDDIIREAHIIGNPESLSKRTTLKIIEQMEKSVCKIVKNESTGTGFIVLLPFPDKLHPLPVLITCYHVLKNEDIEAGKQIKLIFNDNEEIIIQMNKTRKIYTSDESKYDITIIELEQKDNIKSNNLLELDFALFEEEAFNYKYKNLSIYIIHYPKGKEGEYSVGVVKSIVQNNSQIHHLCSTKDGSSGGPIFNLQTFNVIGMHQGKRSNFNFNIGVILKIPIQEYYQKYKNDLNQINDKDSIRESLNSFNDNKIKKFEKEKSTTKSKHDSQEKYVEKFIENKKKEKYTNKGKKDSMITKIDKEEKEIIIEIMENYICKISYKLHNKNIEDIGFLVSIAFSDFSIKGFLTKYYMDEKSLNDINKIVILSNKELYELNFNNRFFFSDSFLNITFIEIDNLKFDYLDIPKNNNIIENPLLIKY